MQITTLIQVMNYLKEMAGNSEIMTGYKRLSEVIKEASLEKHADLQIIAKEKEKLCKVLAESDPSEWSFESYRLFVKLDSDHLFGKKAMDYFHNLEITGNSDFQNISDHLSRKIISISELSDSLGKFQQLFNKLIPNELYKASEEVCKKSTILLYFERHLCVQNVADLERYSRLWDSIFNVFTRLTGEENLSLDISSLSDGIFVLGVVTKEKTHEAFTTGITGILSTLPFILRIRKIQIEIADLPLAADINNMLEQEIETLLSQSSSDMADRLVSHYNKNIDYSEVLRIDIARALKQILSFVEKGGKIECRPINSGHDTALLNKSLIEYTNIALELQNLSASLDRKIDIHNKPQEEKQSGVLTESIL